MSKTLALVGGMPITEDEVNEFLMNLGQRGQMYNNPEGRKEILKQLVANKLMLLDAKRNLFEAEAEFKAQLARRFQERQGLYITHRTADFDDRDIAIFFKSAEAFFDFIGDVRNDLHRRA